MDTEQAFDLEAKVLAARAIERRSWVVLAEQLTTFHASEAWRLLGWEHFTDWLGVPEVGIGRRTAYRLLQAWRWALDNHVSPEALSRTDLTKLCVVIPATRDGRVSIEEAVSDAEVLSRSDLVEKYLRGAEDGAQRATAPVLEECPDCGRQRART